MNALLVLDYYVWKIFVVRIRPAWFRLKPISFLSLLYVSLFPLPRKFLLHYFWGKGSPVKVDTRELVLRNPHILASLKRRLEDQLNAYQGDARQGDGKQGDGKQGDGKQGDASQGEERLTVTPPGSEMQRIFIGQHLVSNPNHRYSIGSLNMDYNHSDDLLHISLESEYRFSGNNDRITKYLHQWLNRIRESGAATNFKIEGNVWTISRRALMSSEGSLCSKKYIDYNILYI